MCIRDRTITLFSALGSSNGSLTKLGAGRLNLVTANTYSGGTTLSAGTLGIYHNTSAGSGTLTISADATLLLGRSVTQIANAMVLSGTVTINFDNAVDYLIVGGGGGGSSGGGGAGGVVYQSADLASSLYAVTVGAGGSAGVPSSSGSSGGNGQSSLFNGVTASGGCLLYTSDAADE